MIGCIFCLQVDGVTIGSTYSWGGRGADTQQFTTLLCRGEGAHTGSNKM